MQNFLYFLIYRAGSLWTAINVFFKLNVGFELSEIVSMVGTVIYSKDIHNVGMFFT